MLSVTAKPFHPTHGKEIDAIIYNDGIPSLSYYDENENKSETEITHDFLRSITDETIEEAFPPSAEDAAELDEVDVFVELMASLAHLEEREERTRFDPDYKLFGKRWMSRRELVDKPHPPKHTITPVIHSTSGKSAVVNMNVGGINEKKDNLVAYTGDP